MKKAIMMMLFLVCGLNCFPQSKNTQYDDQLAHKLGADEYGMKTYVMAFLKTGPVNLTDSARAAAVQKAHLKNIMLLAGEGKIVVAGPFLDNQELRGIFIYNVRTIAEAKQLVATDPAVQAGVLVVELHPWYGSAALTEVPAIDTKIKRKSILDINLQTDTDSHTHQ